LAKKNIPKKWYSDIILSAAKKTNIKNTHQKLNNDGLNFIFDNSKEAALFELMIGQYILRSIRKYMRDNNIDRNVYSTNLMFVTDRNDLVVNIYW